jgi:hypothetical protein
MLGWVPERELGWVPERWWVPEWVPEWAVRQRVYWKEMQKA